MKSLLRGLSHLLFPALCEGCRKPLLIAEKVLCLSCNLQLPETNYHHIPGNETELRFAGRLPFVAATSFAYFTNEGLLQHLIHGLKYDGKKENGAYLGALLGNRLKRAAWGASIDYVVPVPLHPAKEAKRGYNQSALIAKGLGQALGVPVLEHMLIRVRNTESQTTKSRSERVENMKDAFQLRESDMLSGKHILLCDDVLTTGATMEACALALQVRAATKISLCTIGIAVS